MRDEIRFFFVYRVRGAIARASERLLMWLAWHAIPKQLRVWIVVRAFADATTIPPGDTKTPNEVGYDVVMAAMR